MSDKRYPTRMHEVLGVEPDKVYTWRSRGKFSFYVNQEGEPRNSDGGLLDAVHIIALVLNPERIIRKPRLSEEQVRQLRALVTIGCLWLVQDDDESTYALVSTPHKSKEPWYSRAGGFQISVDSPTACLIELVKSSDPEPLDIVATLKANGVEIEEDK
jgi:hypothetical protein